MANTYDLVFKLAAQFQGQFGKTLSTAADQVAKLSNDVVEFNNQLSSVSKLQSAKVQLEQLSKSFYKQKVAMEEAGVSLRQLQAPQSVIHNAMKKEEVQLKKTSAEMARKKAEVERLTAQLGLNSYATRDVVKRQAELQAAVSKTNKALRVQQIASKLKASWQNVENAQVNVATSMMNVQTAYSAVERVVSAPLKAAMAMEDTMADIRKVVDFKTPDGLAKMQRDLEEMSLRIPLSVKGLGEITAAAGQAGIAEEDLLNFTEAAAKMGVAFDVTAAEAGEMMAKWRSGMGLTQAQAVELADATNALSNANAATGKQIGEALKRYGALGKVAGLSEKQTAALAATVIGAGAEAEVAATGLNSMMRALTKGGSMSEKQAAAFKNIGFDPQQLQKDIQTNAPKAIMDVLESIKVKVPKEMQNQYLSAMFGEEGARALGPLLSNTEALQKNFDLIAQKSNYAGSMQAEFDARSSTLSNTFQLLSNNMEVVKASIGGALIEPFKEYSAKILETGKWIANWIKNNQSLVKTLIEVGLKISAAVVACMAVRLVLVSIGTTIQFAKTAFFGFNLVVQSVKNSMLIASAVTKGYTAVMTVFPAVMSKAAAVAKVLGVALKSLAFNPLTIGIMAAVAAGVLIYKNWDTIKQKAEELWNAFQEKFPGLASAVQSAYDAIKPVIENIKSVFSGIIDFVSGVFSGDWQKAWEGIVQAFSSTFSLIGQFVKAPLNAVIAMINTCIKGINNMANFKVPDWVPGMGGQSFGANIPEIPALASGGIATSPTLAMVGEGKEPEAILPLSEIGRMLQNQSTPGNTVNQSSPISINLNINVTGASDSAGISQSINEAANRASQTLRQELERLRMNELRLSYR